MVGGYPGNDEDGKVMQAKLDRDKIFIDMLNSANFLKGHPLSSGKLGATGFCFGGAVTNYLAAKMGSDLLAGSPFCGSPAPLDEVKNIKAKLVIHYASTDPRVNEQMEPYRKALAENKAVFEMHTYPNTEHGFHNYSTPRYQKEAAKLAWDRTLKLFKEKLL